MLMKSKLSLARIIAPQKEETLQMESGEITLAQAGGKLQWLSIYAICGLSFMRLESSLPHVVTGLFSG